METQEVSQEQQPQQAELHENVLKAQRLVRNFVNKDTEAVLVIKGNGRYALLDMQASKAGKYQMRPDELLNERWREVIPRPPKVTKPSPVLGDEGTAVPILKEPIPNPVISPVLKVGEQASVTLSPPETVVETEEYSPPSPLSKKTIQDAPNTKRPISGKQS